MSRKLIGNQIGPRQFELPPKSPVEDSAGSYVDAILDAVHVEAIRLVAVNRRHRADAVRRQELAFVEHHRSTRRSRSPSRTASRRRSPWPGDRMQATLPVRSRPVLDEPLACVAEARHARRASPARASATASSGIRPTSERTRSGIASCRPACAARRRRIRPRRPTGPDPRRRAACRRSSRGRC